MTEEDRRILKWASCLIVEREASRDLIVAVLLYHEGRGDLSTIKARLSGAENPEQELLPRRNGNVIDGPWAS